MEVLIASGILSIVFLSKKLPKKIRYKFRKMRLRKQLILSLESLDNDLFDLTIDGLRELDRYYNKNKTEKYLKKYRKTEKKVSFNEEVKVKVIPNRLSKSVNTEVITVEDKQIETEKTIPSLNISENIGPLSVIKEEKPDNDLIVHHLSFDKRRREIIERKAIIKNKQKQNRRIPSAMG